VAVGISAAAGVPFNTVEIVAVESPR